MPDGQLGNSASATFAGRATLRCVRTDEARFRELFEEHYSVVARYVFARGHQAADADDLIAATFEVVWRRMDAVPAGREAVPWLLAVARNCSRNAWRKSRREIELLDELVGSVVEASEAESSDGPELAVVVAALKQLKEIDRELILLVAWDELGPSEAGRVLGLHPVTARARLHRARQRLHALLDPPDPTSLDAVASRTGRTSADDRRELQDA